MFTERGIPPELQPKARAWFEREMARLEPAHGDQWAANREWLADYLNAELRIEAAKKALDA